MTSRRCMGCVPSLLGRQERCVHVQAVPACGMLMKAVVFAVQGAKQVLMDP